MSTFSTRRASVVVSFFLVSLVLSACGNATTTPTSLTTPTVAVTATALPTVAANQTAGPAVAAPSPTAMANSTPTALVATVASTKVASTISSPRPGLLREASGNANPPTLDPAGLGAVRQILLNVFGGLVAYNEKSELVPLGAESWTISPDGKVYTFKLRPELKFQNNKAVTASDFVWSLKRNLDPKRKAAAAFNLTDIVGAEDYLNGKNPEIAGLVVKDERTLEISLTKIAPYFLAKLALPIAAVLDRAEVETNERWWEKHAASIGPFSLKEWKKGQSIYLAANPNYAYGKPKVDIELVYVADAQARQAMYEAGETDILWSIGEADLERIRKDAKLAPQLIEPTTLSYRTYSLVLNPKAYAPFQDIRVRQAVAMAIDRETLVKQIFRTCAVPKGIIPSGTVAGYNPNLKIAEYNPEKARQLLADAGFPGGQNLPELVFTEAGASGSSDYMQYFQNQLNTNLGLKVKLEVLERGKYLEELRKTDKLQAVFEGVSGDYLDPQTILSVPLNSKSPANLYGYNNPEFDRLVTQADSETNSAKRFELYGQAEQQVLTDAAWTPICQGYSKLMVQPYVSGYRLNPLGIMPYDKVEVK